MTDHTPTPEQAAAQCEAYLKHPAVQGHCPACGGESLFLGSGGYVTCARLDCSKPDAASTLLAHDPRTTPEAVYRWAESVASSGAGDAAIIEVDITTPTGTEPVVIPLTQARELHDMLGGVLAEHDAPDPHPEPTPCSDDHACCTRRWRTTLAAERAAHEERRSAVSEALGGNTVDWPEVIRRVRKAVEDRDGQRAEVRRLRGEHEEHRQQLAEALGGLGPDTPWDSLIRRATQVLAGRHRAFDMAQEIEADRDRLAVQLTNARPRCTCAGVGFGNGDCAVHYPPKVEPEPEAPCFHPSWQTEPTVGARKCTDCGEWLDPQPPAPAELDGAALWAAIRDHAFNDTQWWRKVNRRRDHAQLNTYVQRGPGHTPTR